MEDAEAGELGAPACCSARSGAELVEYHLVGAPEHVRESGWHVKVSPADVVHLVFAANAVGLFDFVFENQFCNLMFRCGCTWPWAGGDKNCNVYNKTGPRCPFCASRGVIVVFTHFYMYSIVAYCVQFMRKRSIWRAVVWSVGIYALSGLITGLAFKLASGYPYFLWFG